MKDAEFEEEKEIHTLLRDIFGEPQPPEPEDEEERRRHREESILFEKYDRKQHLDTEATFLRNLARDLESHGCRQETLDRLNRLAIALGYDRAIPGITALPYLPKIKVDWSPIKAGKTLETFDQCAVEGLRQDLAALPWHQSLIAIFIDLAKLGAQKSALPCGTCEISGVYPCTHPFGYIDLTTGQTSCKPIKVITHAPCAICAKPLSTCDHTKEQGR